MTSKKASHEATPDRAQSRRNRGKIVRRSLVEASKAQDAALLARELRTSQTQHELAVIVVVEFTGELRTRKQLTGVARLARSAAAVIAGEEALSDNAVSTDDFDSSRAEFEELARSAGATIAATLVQRRQRPDPSSLVGQGKLDEIVEVVASTNASLVLFDHDLTPSQLRNIESRLGGRCTRVKSDVFQLLEVRTEVFDQFCGRFGFPVPSVKVNGREAAVPHTVYI